MGMDEYEAFYITARIFRGGGFTKDYLYLKGFRDVLKYHGQHKDLTGLLIGKTSMEYKPLITEMTDRGIIHPPRYRTRSFLQPVKPDPIIEYVLAGLK
jgi:hypothetical protein